MPHLQLEHLAQGFSLISLDVWALQPPPPGPLSNTWASLFFIRDSTSKDWLPQLEKFKSKSKPGATRWLNAAGKSVLIKSVLSSLPLFQFAGLLAPATIIKKNGRVHAQVLLEGRKTK
jgi:hypothetical protein